MSCHIELDFHDDGTVTRTGRYSKEGEVETRTIKTPSFTIDICAGADMTPTHTLHVMSPEEMERLFTCRAGVMIDRAGILRILAHGHGRNRTPDCEEINTIVRALIAENDKLDAENKSLTKALQRSTQP